MNPLRSIVATLFFCVLSIASLPAAAVGLPAQENAAQIWQMLDYMAVDYGGAVADGKVINADEYAEMREFAATAERQLSGLPDRPGKAGLVEQASALKVAIDRKVAVPEVATRANALASALLVAYPVPLSPARLPDLGKGAALYQAHCASCHGAEGRGNGPLAARLNPAPIDFTDRDRARERSIFSLHQSITRGVEGTSMPAFPQLSEEERWALSFFVSAMAFGPHERDAGGQRWAGDKELQARVPNLDALTQLSESSLARTVAAADAAIVLAYLRSNPQALAASTKGGLALSKARLQESLAALESGDSAQASRLALSAYLDGFEPMEPALAIRNRKLLGEIEQAMLKYRSAVSASDVDAARASQRELQDMLSTAQQTLNESGADNRGVFLGALAILLREGLEALLVVVAMVAFLKKAGRNDALGYVRVGWISALAAGGATWFLATYLIEVSGASRELVEGFSALFAAFVLLAVGIWMHGKSLAGRWQAYMRDKLASALGKRSGAMLFLLAFVTVYREVFETILFYAAMWNEGTEVALLAGFATGVLILAALAVVMLRTSARLPIGQFFALSSALVAVLAIMLTGKGVSALQEAGMIAITPIAGPNIDLLGISPTLQTMSAQLAVLLTILAGLLANWWMNARRPAASPQQPRA